MSVERVSSGKPLNLTGARARESSSPTQYIRRSPMPWDGMGWDGMVRDTG